MLLAIFPHYNYNLLFSSILYWKYILLKRIYIKYIDLYKYMYMYIIGPVIFLRRRGILILYLTEATGYYI